jgi:SNF family Na+-dependent transporter
MYRPNIKAELVKRLDAEKQRRGMAITELVNSMIENALRFPVQATQNGGGAFIIQYFCAMICLAVPLMWCEWARGRMGGALGHGTMPGIFQLLWHHLLAKYLGALGVVLPVAVGRYYVYVQS